MVIYTNPMFLFINIYAHTHTKALPWCVSPLIMADGMIQSLAIDKHRGPVKKGCLSCCEVGFLSCCEGEDISVVLFGSNMFSLDNALYNVILDIKSVYIDMLHPIMIHCVMSYTDCRLVIAADDNWFNIRNLKIWIGALLIGGLVQTGGGLEADLRHSMGDLDLQERGHLQGHLPVRRCHYTYS